MLEVTVKIDGFDEEGNPTSDVQAEIINGVIERLSRHLEDGIRKAVDAQFRSTIAAKLETSIDDYLKKPIQMTNNYGEPKGVPSTLIELIADKGREYLTQNVDASGSARNYGDNKIPRVQWLAQKMAAENLNKELAPLLDKAKSDAKAFITTKVATALKEAMAAAIK